MANGTATDDEIDQEEEQGQDDRQPTAPVVVAALPVAAPRQQAIVAPPGAAPVAPPTAYPQWTQSEGIARGQAMGNAQTMDQAEKAIAAAQRFQAQRGYQRDIANGVSAVDAMVKWGPLMFGSTAGSASALARVAVAAQPKPERVMGAGGQIYRVPAKGNAVRITPETPAKLEPHLAAAYAKEIAENEQKIDQAKDAFSPKTDALRNRNFYLRQQLQPFSPRAGLAVSPPTAVPAAVPAPAGPAAAPTVTTKAQFDALAPGAIYVGKNGRKYRKP